MRLGLTECKIRHFFILTRICTLYCTRLTVYDYLWGFQGLLSRFFYTRKILFITFIAEPVEVNPGFKVPLVESVFE